MSNSAVVRALRRRINFYLNSPVFNKYGKSLRDFLTVSGLTVISLFLLSYILLWVTLGPDNDMTGIGSCGTADCIDQ